MGSATSSALAMETLSTKTVRSLPSGLTFSSSMFTASEDAIYESTVCVKLLLGGSKVSTVCPAMLTCSTAPSPRTPARLAAQNVSSYMAPTT